MKTSNGIVWHDTTQHPMGAPCEFCDRAKKEFADDTNVTRKSGTDINVPTKDNKPEWKIEFDRKFDKELDYLIDLDYKAPENIMNFIADLLLKQREEIVNGFSNSEVETVKGSGVWSSHLKDKPKV